MKVINKSQLYKYNGENILRECKILRDINDPFIVKLYHSFQTKNFLCLVMDFCAGGELF